MHDIKRQASGRWAAIMAAFVPNFPNTPNHGACPIHGGKDGFRLFPNFETTGGSVCATCGAFPSGFKLLMHLNSWTFAEAAKAVDSFLGSTSNLIALPVRPNIGVQKGFNQKAADNLKAVILQSTIITNLEQDAPAVARYFENRGLAGAIACPPLDLLFNSNMAYFQDSKVCGRFPCLLGIVRNSDNEIVSLHRTFLSEAGKKAPVPSPKKLMPPAMPGSTNGAAIRLYPASEVLAVAEGIETAIAVHLATGWPVWACVSAHGLASLILPPQVRTLYIMADKDKSKRGEQAALQLAKRYRHLHTIIYQPAAVIPDQAKGCDWLDVLTTCAEVTA